MSRSEGSETAAAAFLDEGRRTIGVWLPLALADVLSLLVCLVRALSTHPEKVEVPTRSETLEGWMLPMLADSLKAAEEEEKALVVYHQVQAMAAKQQAKEAAK